MNTLWNTQMHWLTLVIITLEVMLLLFYQLPHYLSRPQDQQRLWFLMLLVLLIHYNFWNGLLPDPKGFAIPVKIQYMIIDGIAYLMGAYFPFYFYKSFELHNLRFHATYGVTFFLLVPYALFDAAYAANGQLVADREWSAAIPAVYGLVVLIAMYRAIRLKYTETEDRGKYIEGMAVYMAILPWEAMSAFAFKSPDQELKIVMANLGILVIAFFLIIKAIKKSRWEYRFFKKTADDPPPPPDFLENCAFYGFSKVETEVAGYVRKGLSNKKIAALIFRGEETVKSHISSMLKKTGAKNRAELSYLLEHKHPAPDT